MIAQLPIPEERGSGRNKPPAYFHPDPNDNSIAIVFLWEGSDKRNCYTVQLQRRHGGKWLLGAIERNERLECWYITHLGRNPISKGESFPFLSYSDSAQYLYEDWLQKRRAQVKATLAEA